MKVPESELELSTNITQAWDDLFLESRRVDASLVSVKKKFTEVSHLHCDGYTSFKKCLTDLELAECYLFFFLIPT